VEVVRLQPGPIGDGEPARRQVLQRPQAPGALEDEIDHLGRDPEVLQHQERHPSRYRLQGCSGGDSHQATSAAQCHPHGPGREPDSVLQETALRDEAAVELGVGPLFGMGLLLGIERPQLDDAAPGGGKADQDPLALPRVRGDFRLRGEDDVPSGSCTQPGRLGDRQERQPSETEAERSSQVAGEGAELRDLAVTVQEEQVTGHPKRHRPWACRHADARQSGHQDGPVLDAERPVGGEAGHDRPGTGEQDDVGALLSDPCRQLAACHDVHRSWCGRGDLVGGGHHRVRNHYLRDGPAGGHGSERRGAPLEVGVGVGDGQDPRHPAAEAGRLRRLRGHRERPRTAGHRG
jgi:hypothetical protein